MGRGGDDESGDGHGDEALLLDDFAAMAIHELGGPVLAMSLHVELAAGRVRQLKDQAERDALMDLVDKQRTIVAELRATLTTLTRATRVGAGRETLDRAELDLVPLARSVVERNAAELHAAGCRVSIAAPHPVVGRWDAGHVEIVMKNLITNAAKHARGKPVSIVVDGDERTARVVVEDGGPGIPLAERATVFERFRRLSASSETKGMGLGLWIANVLVQAHGGAIHVDDSKELGGASFVVALPRN